MSAIGGIRTIWITIRAMNYASRAFGDLQKDIGGLMGSEGKLGALNKDLIKSTLDYVVAGTMMATLSSQMAMSILNMAMQSREGAGQMAQLKQQIFLTTQALDNAAYQFLKATGALTLLNNILKMLQQNKGLDMFIIAVVALVSILAALAAVVFITAAAFKAFFILDAMGIPVMSTLAQVAVALGVSFNVLLISIGACVASFMVFYMIATSLTGWARTIVSAIMLIVGALVVLAVAEGLVTGGLSTIIGGIGAGAAAAGGASLATQSYQGGTRSVPRTGPVFAHEGEIIYNPSTNRPLQVGNDLGAQGSGVTQSTTQIVIENVHTKADIDDLGPELNQAYRKAARSRR